MPNLVVVGIGDNSEIRKMIKLVQKLFSSFCNEWDANVYNLDTLDRAECDKNLLKKKGCLSFSTTKHTFSKQYFGIIGCEDYDELYSRWFETRSNGEYVPHPRWYYNRTLLEEIVKEKFDPNNKEESFSDSDIVIKYHYERCENSTNEYVVFQLGVDNNCIKTEKNHILSQFNDIIKMLDENCPSIFVSGYITNLTMEYPISHMTLYEFFSADDLKTYILGVEYSIYMGDALHQRYRNVTEMRAEGFSINDLKNGVQYTSNVDIDAFNDEHRTKLLDILENALIPAYGCFDWDGLCRMEKRACPLPTMVHVYVDDVSWRSPLIMFPYKLDNKYVAFEASKRLVKGKALLDAFAIS